MKYIFLSLMLLLSTNIILGQCYPDRHSATWYDGWISCDTLVNPNPARGVTHFIKYDLDDIYYLYEMKIWNTNAPDLLDYGIQDVVIDISVDGLTWVEFGQFTFNQATGENNFEGYEEIDFGGEKAKYILFTPLSNYGGNCYGLSEIKLRGRKLCQSSIITWNGGIGDWDIASNWCGNQVPTITDSVWIPPKNIVSIPLLFNAESKWIEVDKNATLTIHGSLNVVEN